MILKERVCDCVKSVCDGTFRPSFNICPLTPGTICYATGITSIILGLAVKSISELACAFLTAGSGFGCIIIGGPICCLAYGETCHLCCEVFHKQPSEYCGCTSCDSQIEVENTPSPYVLFKKLFEECAKLQEEQGDITQKFA